MADVAPLKYGRVVARFLVNTADGPDIDDLPEFRPLAGTATFTAEVPKVLVAGAVPNPATYVQLPQHYVASLDEFGYLTWRGKRGIRLVAPGPETNPKDWTWRVEFDLSYDGDRVPIEAFSFRVPEYIPGPNPAEPDTGSTGLVDLTLVSPIPSSAGTAIVRGPQGEGLQIDRRVATYGDLPATPAEGNGAQYVVAADDLLYVYRTGTGWMPNGQGVRIRGAQGIQGIAGDPGPVNSLVIGTVTTGAAGASASASITGTPPSQVLNLTIPRGNTGDPGPAAPDASTSTKGILQLGGVLAGNATAQSFSASAFGTSSSTACRGDDARLTNTRTPSANTVPCDFVWVAQTGTRVTGVGDLAAGMYVGRAFTVTKVVYQFDTADASGSTTVECRRNGSQIASSALTVSAANQADGTGTDAARSATFTQAFAVGDRFALAATSLGTTPGKGLRAYVFGTWD